MLLCVHLSKRTDYSIVYIYKMIICMCSALFMQKAVA
jgi:hypothetical protein